MTPPSRVIVIGAGIVGLASAYHILRQRPGVDLVVVERLAGPGLGDTAKSAAAFRDMFSSRVNRELSQGSIAFYEKLEAAGGGHRFYEDRLPLAHDRPRGRGAPASPHRHGPGGGGIRHA